jgi:hypothetical protein
MSLYSSNCQEREHSKDQYEEQGARAHARGVKRWQNPHCTLTEREDMRDYPGWFPQWGSGKDENLPAYYWDIGWENANG